MLSCLLVQLKFPLSSNQTNVCLEIGCGLLLTPSFANVKKAVVFHQTDQALSINDKLPS